MCVKQYCTAPVLTCMNSLLDSESNQVNSNQESRGEGRTVASETGTRKQGPVASEEADASDNSGSCSADGKTDTAGQVKAQEFDFNDFFKDGVLKLIVSSD